MAARVFGSSFLVAWLVLVALFVLLGGEMEWALCLGHGGRTVLPFFFLPPRRLDGGWEWAVRSAGLVSFSWCGRWLSVETYAVFSLR